jgi:predicted TIM-barrel fold metal-dependent hydrolase
MAHDLTLHEFTPRSMLALPTTPVEQPRYPVIDTHNHLGQLVPGAPFAGSWPARPVAALVDELDRSGVRAVVDLDGGIGEQLRAEIARYCEPYPERFIVFAGIDYDAFERERDIGRHLACQLRNAAALGVRGLKVWKLLGLRLRDTTGRRFAVNDARLDELWTTAGELGLPVLIHVADPVAFFQPLDRFNERWEELAANPDWHCYGGDAPAFETLIAQFADLVARHKATTFIGAHVGCYAENLGWVSHVLDICPNLYIDISARIAELGRQPFSARDLFIRHAGRVLFGTDLPPSRSMYQLHYRFLETRDEYFNYTVGPRPAQGRWQIYGLHLPDDVLRRVYYENAAALFGLPPLDLAAEPAHGPMQRVAELSPERRALLELRRQRAARPGEEQASTTRER